jgi:hypothetical protein
MRKNRATVSRFLDLILLLVFIRQYNLQSLVRL